METGVPDHQMRLGRAERLQSVLQRLTVVTRLVSVALHLVLQLGHDVPVCGAFGCVLGKQLFVERQVEQFQARQDAQQHARLGFGETGV